VARVYLAEPAPFVHPGYFHKLGASEMKALTPGAGGVSAAIRWGRAAIPAGPYSLIAELLARGPAPSFVPGPGASLEAAVAHRLRSNRMAVRNVQEASARAAGTADFTLHLLGVPRAESRFSYAVRSRFPAGTTVRITTDRRITVMTASGSTTTLASPHPGAPLTTTVAPFLLADVVLKPDERIRLGLAITVPPGARPGKYVSVVDQRWSGLVIGRMWFELTVTA